MGGFSLLLHCSHLISIGRWLADMSLRLACLLIGGRRRRGRSRIGLFGSERWHIRQFRQIAVLPVSILEFGFPTSGIRTHPLPFGFWQHRLPEAPRAVSVSEVLPHTHHAFPGHRGTWWLSCL